MITHRKQIYIIILLTILIVLIYSQQNLIRNCFNRENLERRLERSSHLQTSDKIERFTFNITSEPQQFSEKQKSVLLDIAKKYGVSEVEDILIHRAPITRQYSIIIKEKERIQNNDVFFNTLTLKNEKWTNSQDVKDINFFENEFKSKIESYHYKKIKYNGIECYFTFDNMPFQVCVDLLTKLMNNQYTYIKDGHFETKDFINFDQPVDLFYNTKESSYHIAFDNRTGNGFYMVELFQVSDSLFISEVASVIF